MALIPGRARVLELKWTRGTAREKVKCCHPSRNFHCWLFHGLSPVVLCTLVKVARRCTRASFSSIDQAICESKRAVKEREERSLIIPFLVACSEPRCSQSTVTMARRKIDPFYRRFREFRENCLLEKSRWRFWIRFEFGDRWIMEWKLWWVTNIFFFFGIFGNLEFETEKK